MKYSFIRTNRKLRFFSLFFAFIGIIIIIISYGFSQYKKQSYRCDLGVIGPIKFADGIGRQTIGLIDCLKDSVSIQFEKRTEAIFKDVPAPIVRIAKAKFKQSPKVVIYESPLLHPGTSLFKTLPDAEVKIAYSMLESSKISQNWVFILNNYFDAVVVPDVFLIDVYKNSGVTIPIFEIPLGVYFDSFEKPTSPRSKPNQRPFVFGNLSGIFPHKNQLNLVKAFAREFGNDPAVCLLLNGRSADEEYIRQINEVIESQGLKNVLMTRYCLGQQAYADLFASLDCYVSPSKGEGFSVQPREALSMGIPAIVTDNTAQSTICKSGFVCSVPSKKPVEAQYGVFKAWHEELGYQFDCEIEDLATSMRSLYENYNECALKAYEGRKWVERYRYDNLKKLYQTLVLPEKVILADRNSIEEGAIYTTSQELCNKYEIVTQKQNKFRKLFNRLLIWFYQS